MTRILTNQLVVGAQWETLLGLQKSPRRSGVSPGAAMRRTSPWRMTAQVRVP